jgi:TonB family protein
MVWNISFLTMEDIASARTSVQGAVSTIDSITGAPPLPLTEASHDQSSNDNRGSHPVPATPEPPQVTYIRVSSGVTQGLVVKKVQPNYPQEARYNHIQGSVHLSAVINKTGDVVDLEVIDGPIELVVSAVNAVRQWKYRPYILKGEPMAVQTVITVNYQLSGG